LQACFSFALSAGAGVSCAVAECMLVNRFDAWIVAPVPASKPAIAALAISIFFDLVMILLPSSMILLLYLLRAEPRPEDIRHSEERCFFALRLGALRYPGQLPGV